MTAENAHALVRALGMARAALEARAAELDDLNVFPVPDGDTGTNMLLTVRAAEAAALDGGGPEDGPRTEHVVRQTLVGARGNSGMILSQLVRGAAEQLDGRDDFDSEAVADALRGASEAAYAAVEDPREGTILTIARRMADAAVGSGGDTAVEALAAALRAGREALDETPDMLAELREAGVVDSGGLGLLVLLEGVLSSLDGTARAPAPSLSVAAPVGAVDHPPSRYRYCTTFLLEGSDIDLDSIRFGLASLGDSLLVMGDGSQVKVHIHTDDPEAATAAGRAHGTVDAVRADDMHRQQEERAERLASAARSSGRSAPGAGEMTPDTPLGAGTALITDSASDLPTEARLPTWYVVPVPIAFGTEAFLDGVDLDREAFYERLRTADRPPTTAQPSVAELAEVMEAALRDHETAVGVFMSGRLSGTAAAARKAAAEVAPDRILCIESQQISLGLGLLAHRLQARLDAGTTAQAIQRAAADMRDRQRTVFTLDTLEYLQRGGRIGRAKAVVGTLLGVRPVLQIADGEVTPAGTVRGSGKAIAAIQRFVEERTDPDRPLWLAYAHTRRAHDVPEVRAAVEGVRPAAETAFVAEIGPTVGTHAGPGALGVAFLHDDG